MRGVTRDACLVGKGHDQLATVLEEGVPEDRRLAENNGFGVNIRSRIRAAAPIVAVRRPALPRVSRGSGLSGLCETECGDNGVVAIRSSRIASGMAPDVLRVEIPDRGTYHRLRIAAFDSREAAQAFCSTLQSRGQDCLVARR
mgnify:CR=1 FL=1